jgi:hypothetical protein
MEGIQGWLRPELVLLWKRETDPDLQYRAEKVDSTHERIGAQLPHPVLVN